MAATHVYRTLLEKKLTALNDVSLRLLESANLMCVLYRGKEFAHFHDDQEIDIRLSQKFINAQGLTPLEGSNYHPNRSKKSRWMQFRFQSEKDVLDLIALVEQLLKTEYQNSSWGEKA